MEYKFINTEYIDSVAGGDMEILTEIINMFREQVVEVHAEMKLLLETREYYNLGLLAHKAKSSVAIMGMKDLAVMLKNFELEAKESKGVENYGAYIERFRDETANAVKELEDLLGRKN